MFFLFAISVCALSVVNSHYLDVITPAESVNILSFNALLLMGSVTFSGSSMRNKSVLDVFFIWTAWVFMTDWFGYIPPIGAVLETVLFVILTAWVYFRSYKHQSLPPNPENVCIAFYGGPNAPVASRLASHFGFAFSSVALVAGSIGLRPSKTRGCMVETSAQVLSSKGYVFIDTGIPISPKIHGIIKEVIGSPTGYGVLYFKCLLNLEPILACLGSEWIPKKMGNIPSGYYSQCMRNLP